uniref:Uncharacterized protein n=1 Tax=Panagrolaimus sp. JU765 TaxID=591449 RepID=A0AC34QKU9_9BILA
MSNFSIPFKSFNLGKASKNTPEKLNESKQSSPGQNSRLDFSAHLLDASSKRWDKDTKCGQVPDVIDFIRWITDEDQNSSVVTAGNSTRSLSLVNFDANGIALPGRRFLQSYVQKLHELDFPSRITSVSSVKNGFFVIGHANGSLRCVQKCLDKLNVQTTVQETGDSPVSSVALSSDFVVSGTEKGQIFVDRPNSGLKKTKVACLESGISALCADFDLMLLAGTMDGKIVLFDLREHSKNGVLHLNLDADMKRTSLWANRYTDGIKSVDMQADYLIAAGTNEGVIRFADLRKPDEDESRHCRIKIADSAVGQVKFNKNGNKKFYACCRDGFVEMDFNPLVSTCQVKFNKSGNKQFYACCRDGFVEMDFNPLVSTWFDDNATKPLFLCNEFYHKIDRRWFKEFPNVSSFDFCNDHVVVASRGGDLAFFS